MDSTVVIVSKAGDFHAEAMAAVLERDHGVVPYRLDMREFPLQATANWRDDAACSGIYAGPAGPLALQDVRSVWWRRPEPCLLPNIYYGIDPGFAQAECDHFLQGLLWSRPCLWVNDPMRQLFASRKVVQLQRAAQAGLRIPRTLITNEPEQARAFIAEMPSRVIFKRTGTSAGTPAAKTQFVTPEIMDRLQTVATSPTTFQEYIEPRADIRVVWIDGQLWAVAIDSPGGVSPEDSRFDNSVSFTPHRLPPCEQERVSHFMRDLCLVYGAIDLRLDPKGDYYFLEVNPAGQFLYLELKTGLPLLSALASVLARGHSPA